jgi:hypothetical protein
MEILLIFREINVLIRFSNPHFEYSFHFQPNIAPKIITKNKSSIESTVKMLTMSTPDPFRRYEEEKEKFDASPQSFAIIQQVRKQILPQESIFIDNALCLGLGTLEDDDVPNCGVERGSQLLIFKTVLQTLSMYYSFSPPPPNSSIHYSRLLKFLCPLANKNRRKVYH